MGHAFPETLGADVEVIVASASEVGRTGMLKLAPVVLRGREDSVAVAEHNADPQARSVAQQPPPTLEAQDLKPGEHGMNVGKSEEDDFVIVKEEVELASVREMVDSEDGSGVTTTEPDEVLVGAGV